MNLNDKPVQNILPNVKHGKIERIANFPSRYVSPRHIDIWLPDEYRPDGKHPVLYMHDGQMLFDTSITWNQQSWGVAEVLSKLIAAEAIPPCIVIGIWNVNEDRHSDYFPQKPFAMLPDDFRAYLSDEAKRDDGAIYFPAELQSDRYLKFIVDELKPLVDKRFATAPERDATFIAGSSMGGLISIYALCEYPDIFDGAACLSTHWTGIHTNENNPIPDAFANYLRESLPDPATHRVYFDYGTETLDALYEPHQLRVDAVMRNRGYDASNWQTLKFDGEEHSEVAWRKRLHIPLKFLLATTQR